MGTRVEYVCRKCDFRIIHLDLMYFIDEETNCVVEHAYGKLTFNMGYGSKINGRVFHSFCSDCSSEVHFYYNENESYVNEIKSAIEQGETDFKDVLNEKYEYRRISSELKGVIGSKDRTYGKCPKCGKKLPIITEKKCECPKCGGELCTFMIAMYD